MKSATNEDLFPKTKASLVENLPTLEIKNETELGAPVLTKTDANAYSLQATLLYDIIDDSPYTFSNGHTKATAVAGDICYYGETAIGVVVIPASHMTDGNLRIMSLAEMTEDGVGSLTEHNVLTWGVTDTDTALNNYTEIPCVGHDDDGAWTPDNIIDHTTSNGYICSDRTDGDWGTVANTLDTATSWQLNDSDCHIASPYNADGTYNTTYGATSYTNASGETVTISNALSDFNGKTNTATLVGLGTDYQASTACSKYSTVGTKSGDWYLPAMGELGYMMVRFNTIQTALNSLGSNALALDDVGCYWSSTEYSSDTAYDLLTDSGNIFGSYNKFDGGYVRAFLSI